MPIRLMHYVACFYSELLKQKVLTPSQGLPPVFPVVLYNGSKPWTAPRDIYAMITPQPPAPLQIYQPRLQYYLVDEGRYTGEDLGLRQTPTASRRSSRPTPTRSASIGSSPVGSSAICIGWGLRSTWTGSIVWWRTKRCWQKI
jgi:hypothetical protein